MESVTDIYRCARRAPAVIRPIATPQQDAIAERLAAWWYSPAGRLIAAALTFAVVLTGLGIAVFGLWALGRHA